MVDTSLVGRGLGVFVRVFGIAMLKDQKPAMQVEDRLVMKDEAESHFNLGGFLDEAHSVVEKTLN
jgi:hypothetical protein